LLSLSLVGCVSMLLLHWLHVLRLYGSHVVNWLCSLAIQRAHGRATTPICTNISRHGRPGDQASPLLALQEHLGYDSCLYFHKFWPPAICIDMYALIGSCRTGHSAGTVGSASCSGRDDSALQELVSQHEQVIQSLVGRVVELQERLDQLHEGEVRCERGCMQCCYH
jgi:hypothetical protein